MRYDQTVRWMMAVGMALLPTTALAARKDFPCKGCIFEDNGDKLLLVLHGDGQTAAAMQAPWSKPAAAHGVSLVLAKCPAASCWQWNGDPKWLDDMVDAVARERTVDARRVWLAGWSGGASYLGLHAFALQRFAAVSFDGGGLAPSGTCRPIPSYFLVGDQNPYHQYAVELRDALGACGSEVVWDLRKGAGHPAEWSALLKSSDAILTWFEAHPKAPSFFSKVVAELTAAGAS